ncbi:MAG: sulfate adenylyltransferase subunit CysN [Alphaproteobacteria bacterium]|nr:sulfate adenylyltransferase subunit CysN [Alphaproteobacteria bacterium]
MAHQSALIAEDIESYLQSHAAKGLLRFITCGSVDDGKSTLIGRLLYDSKMIFDDQLSALAGDSKKFGTTGGELDLALLVDGLAAEREQGITIDVAYRFFSTDRRKFIVADTPGHEQYTRNMATGASMADLAIVIVDARKGILTQTRRHSMIVSMLGVKRVVLAVNKMDMVIYDEKVFRRIEKDYAEIAAAFGLKDVLAIPVSALRGDNVTALSENTPWYEGPSLLEHLETVEIHGQDSSLPFRMPVQWVNRPNADFRGFAGRIASGAVAPGTRVKILPSGKLSSVARIVTYDGDLEESTAGQSVTLTLADEVDVSRGDVIAAADAPCEIADQFETRIIWMSEKPMVASRQYLLQSGTARSICTPAKPKYRIDMQTLEHEVCKTLAMNEIGVCDIALDRKIAFEPYALNRTLGAFILIDRLTHETVAAGMITHALRRSQNVHLQDLSVDQAARAAIKGQKPCTIWMTGLSGAGKSTIANVVEKKLNAMAKHTVLLDGDNLRHGLNKDLGFTEQDRAENIRRVAEVAKLMMEAGLIALVSFISPFRAEREMARELIGEGRFIEVFVDTPLQEAEARDVKGLYKKARAGEIPNFTGISSPYEAPENPELRLETVGQSPEELAEEILEFLMNRDFLSR